MPLSTNAQDFPRTVTFWYKVPMNDGSFSNWCESRFTSSTLEEANKTQRKHWDLLNQLGYELSGRP